MEPCQKTFTVDNTKPCKKCGKPGPNDYYTWYETDPGDNILHRPELGALCDKCLFDLPDYVRYYCHARENYPTEQE